MVIIQEIRHERSSVCIILDTGEQYWIRKTDFHESGFFEQEEYNHDDLLLKIRVLQYPHALNHAVAMLAKRPCSKSEIRTRLIQKRFSEDVSDLVVYKLEKENRELISPNRSFSGWWLRIAAVLVVAFGIFSVVVLNRQTDIVNESSATSGMDVAMADVDNGTRIKGMTAGLEVWKKMGDSAVQMVNLGEAREGDEIQLRYRVPQKCFGMLFSMDGNGTVTMHMGEGNRAVELEPGKMTTLPFAYKLDNAPKFEKFFLLTSGEMFEFDGNDIDKTLKKDGVESVSFTLRKVEK